MYAMREAVLEVKDQRTPFIAIWEAVPVFFGQEALTIPCPPADH
jgi:hypothetical protein